MKDFKIYLSLAMLVLVLYLAAQYNKPLPINWQPTMYYNDKVPFGTYVLYRQLPQIFPDTKVTKTNQTLNEFLTNKGLTNSNYLILSKSVDMNKSDFKEMIDYIRSGNSVFISALEWKGILTDTLNIQTSSEYNQKNIALNFTNYNLKQTDNYKFIRGISIQYFSQFDTAHAVVLGKNELGHSNLLSFKYGKGNLYLCANPLLFTNYNLLNKQGGRLCCKSLILSACAAKHLLG